MGRESPSRSRTRGSRQTAAEDRCGANPLAAMYLAGNEPVMRRKGEVN